jgi:hypothetical protein
MYLVLSAFISSPVFLLATSKVKLLTEYSNQAEGNGRGMQHRTDIGNVRINFSPLTS